MTVNDAVVFILAAFLLWGAADYCLGNRWGLGERFAAGFKAMPLALSMIGIVSLAPVLAAILIPIVAPFYTAIGATLLPLRTPFWRLIWEDMRWLEKWRKIRRPGCFHGCF